MSERRNVDSEPAFILHARNYRETSQLLEAFTHIHGRIGLVAKGARRSKSPFRGALRLFQPLSISWSGRGDLATLRIAECSTSANNLVGTALMFYLVDFSSEITSSYLILVGVILVTLVVAFPKGLIDNEGVN